MAKGLSREATIRTRDEITGPIIAITLVLSRGFCPVLSWGYHRSVFRQFHDDARLDDHFGRFNAMTIDPASCRGYFKSRQHGATAAMPREALPLAGSSPCRGVASAANALPLVARRQFETVGRENR